MRHVVPFAEEHSAFRGCPNSGIMLLATIGFEITRSTGAFFVRETVP
jgi:hypothetical protein